MKTKAWAIVDKENYIVYLNGLACIYSTKKGAIKGTEILKKVWGKTHKIIQVTIH